MELDHRTSVIQWFLPAIEHLLLLGCASYEVKGFSRLFFPFSFRMAKLDIAKDIRLSTLQWRHCM